jgi:cytochrome c553
MLLVLSLATLPAAAQAPLLDKAPRFEKDVLPILTAHCLKCHGEKAKKSGLDLRSVSAMVKGGASGPVIIKGHADKSLLYEQVSKKIMPPDQAPKLSSRQIDTIRDWIDAGALTERPEKPIEAVTAKDREFWSFRPPVRSAIPAVKHSDRVRTPIDAFILEKLEAKGLTLSPDAERLTLLRRVYFDLIGLPPSPEEIDAYLADTRPDAYERLVDKLLASPHYGERWGRHWLDAAGYSDSVGGDNDPGQLFIREGMWQYRDYVVRSLNADKPYDQFVLEQLAGDEMDDWRSAPSWTPVMKEHLIATGLLRLSVDHTTEKELNRPFERYQLLHDTIENLSSNLLGLTVHCARCHDHKFDPIPQADYYRFMAVLKPSFNPEAWIQPQFHHLADVPPKEKESIDKANAEIDRQAAELTGQIKTIERSVHDSLFGVKLMAVPEAIRADVRAALAVEPNKRSEVQRYLAAKLGPLVAVTPDETSKALSAEQRQRIDSLKQQIAAQSGRKRSYGKIQAAWEHDKLPATHILLRGNHLTPGPEVEPGTFAVLTDATTQPSIPSQKAALSSGRRTAWAKWLTRPDNPLTARVFVNRVWQRYFGEGIVATSDNFGHLGARPTHPELLDWLAVEFVECGWKIKALHRLIVTSSVYRQASTQYTVLSTQLAKDPPASKTGAEDSGLLTPLAVDPGNQLLWRQRLRRLESEAIRDAVLAVSGALDRSQGGPPVPIEPHEDGLVVVQTKGLPSTAAYRRSLYLFARRNYNMTLLSVFDQPVMATNCTRRIQSAVPLQSLTLLNDAFMLEQAERFATRVASIASMPKEQIEAAFRIALARRPTNSELKAALDLLTKVTARYAEQPQPERRALAKLCHMLLCTNEFLYTG